MASLMAGRQLGAAVILGATCAWFASARDGHTWLGRKVFTRPQAVLKIDRRVVDDKNACGPYVVERVAGPWLWVVSDPVRGWVKAEDVIPVDEALDYWNGQIRGGKDLGRAHFKRGQVYIFYNYNAKAIRDFDEAIRLGFKDARVFLGRGIARIAEADYDGAIADLDAALRLEPDYAAAHAERGAARRLKGDLDGAIADFGAALRKDPGDALANGGRAWIWATAADEKYRDGPRAIESATRACRSSGWKEPAFLETLAAAYAEVGDFDAAIKWQARALEQLPEADATTRGWFADRLELYRGKKPYREVSGGPAAGGLRPARNDLDERPILLDTARRLVDFINNNEIYSINSMFSLKLREIIPEQKLSEIINSMVRRRGKRLRVQEDFSVIGRSGTFVLTAERGEWRMRLTIDADGAVTGLFFDDPDEQIPVPIRNNTPMRLPFSGEWSVLEGGEPGAQNYHNATRGERCAADFAIRGERGLTYRGNGGRNEDYYAYGREILAPADGEVAVVVDGVPENRPGEVNIYWPAGNCVIIRHSELEFSVACHLKLGSTAVKVGEKVRSGQVIGRCGNSGRSGQPHLHFHLMNSQKQSIATGFKFYFKNTYVDRDGRRSLEAEYSPVRGDLVRQK